MYLLIESDFSRHARESLEAWSWYGTFAGAEAYIEWQREPFNAPWYEHRSNGAEHEWWFGRLHVQWTPWGWRKRQVAASQA